MRRRPSTLFQRPETGEDAGRRLKCRITSIAAPADHACFFRALIQKLARRRSARADAIDSIGAVRLHSLQLRGPHTRPRVRSLNTTWIVRNVRLARTAGPWDTRIAPAAVAASGVMCWLQAIQDSFQKALPDPARTCDPIRPSPRTPQGLSTETPCPPFAASRRRSDGVVLRPPRCRGGRRGSAPRSIRIAGSGLYPV